MGVSIRQKADGGGWWLFVRHAGRRTSKFVRDKGVADELATDLRRALAAGDLGLLQDTRTVPTFTSYAEHYLATAEQTLKLSTTIDYRSNVQRYLVPAFGPRALDAITRAEVKQLALSLRRKGLKPKTARKIIGTLSTILNEAVDDGLLTSNPALGLRKVYRSPDFRDAEKIEISPLTRDELAHLLATARDHSVQRGKRVSFPFRKHYPFLLLLARTGLRLGEAIALQWGDVQWEGGCIEVRRAFVRNRLTTTKNTKTRRVDMSAQLQETLRAAYVTRFGPGPAPDAAGEQACTNAARQWLFTDTKGGIMDADAFRRRVFLPLLQAAQLRHIRMHDLRHTYTSLLLAAGKDLHYIQQQLGHHSPAFTLAVYGHLLPRDRRNEVNCLDDVPPGGVAPGGTPMAPRRRPPAAAKKKKARQVA
ncbi:MAG: tyrosine-type recombinase/integrase [Candidatus Binatia bacterium]|jgi:integrase